LAALAHGAIKWKLTLGGAGGSQMPLETLQNMTFGNYFLTGFLTADGALPTLLKPLFKRPDLLIGSPSDWRRCYV